MSTFLHVARVKELSKKIATVFRKRYIWHSYFQLISAPGSTLVSQLLCLAFGKVSSLTKIKERFSNEWFDFSYSSAES
jgi:hypothetical protein